MKKITISSLLCLAMFPLLAQWTTDTDLNTQVATAQTGDMQSVGTSDGKTFVAYWHDVPAPQYYEMRLQLLDADGNRMFGTEGMLVNNVVAMSSFTTTWSVSIDNQDNVYIGFNGSGAGNPVYVHKISTSGTQLWGPTGINIGAGYDTKILPLSNGETIVAWLPDNTGVFQKIAVNGSLAWANPVAINPIVSGHKTSAGEMAELSNGNFVIVYHDRSGFSPSSLPHAQCYSSTDGAAVWAAQVPISTTYYTAFNRRYPLLADGDHLYFGYTGAQGIPPSAFLQRINADGTLPWGINGKDFSTQTANFERDIKIAHTPDSDVVWAVCEFSNSGESEAGEYVQKFDKTTGNRLLSETAKEVYPISASNISHRGSLQLVENKPLFVVSDGQSNGVFPFDLLAVYLDDNGDFVWPTQTKPVATNASGVKSRIQFNRAANGNSTCVWVEDRPTIGQSRAFAQQVALGCTLPVAGFTFSTVDLTATFASTATDADSIVWDFGDNTTDFGSNTIHTYTDQDVYTVCQTVFNACGAVTICQDVAVTTNGVAHVSMQFGCQISPNPSQGAFSIALSLTEAAACTYQVMGTDGRLVYQQTANLQAGQQTIASDTQLQPGVYYVRVCIGAYQRTLPILVVE